MMDVLENIVKKNCRLEKRRYGGDGKCQQTKRHEVQQRRKEAEDG